MIAQPSAENDQCHDIKPLAGLRVAEFSHMVMGPTAGVILADLGADVLKIEPPGGDNTRRLSGSGAGYFGMYCRNKSSACIDMKHPDGKALAREVVAASDIMLENFRPGAMEALGFGYEAMRALNRGLIYCSLKGFLSGPYSHRTALDEVTQMMGGLAYMTGLPDRPLRAGSSVIDIAGGMMGVVGILAALQERQRTGEGRLVSSALFETTAFLVGQHIAQQGMSGTEPPPMSVRQSAWSIYDIFSCRGGERVFIGVVSDTLWQRFCEAFELGDWATDPTLATNNERVGQRDRLLPRLGTLFAAMDKETLMARLDQAGIPFAPINKPIDLVTDPHLLAAGGLLDITLGNGQTTKLPALPLEFDGRKATPQRDPPEPGAGGRDFLLRAGISAGRLDELGQRGVIACD